MVSGMSLIVYSVWSDFDKKKSQEQEKVFRRIAECRKNYEMRQCHPDMRLPALEAECKNYEICMNEDPDLAVKHVVVTTQLMGEIMMEFVGLLNRETIIFFFVLLFG